jgi:hypothetical protein
MERNKKNQCEESFITWRNGVILFWVLYMVGYFVYDFVHFASLNITFDYFGKFYCDLDRSFRLFSW